MTKPTDQRRSRKSKPTDADREAARRIRLRWELKFKGQISQEALGDRFRDVGESAGITQGAVSQYMHGTVRINTMAVLFFAHALEMDPREIRGDLPEFVLAQLRTELPVGASKHAQHSTSRESFEFPFTPEAWGNVTEEVQAFIVKQMVQAVEMAESPAPGGRRYDGCKS